MSIPKIIHYCWLSGEPYPKGVEACLASWRKFLPDYELRLWDAERFDCNARLYTRQAMEVKKYAFVSDCVRLYALFHEGGIYLDSDVEVYRSFDGLLHNKAFMWFESGGRIGAWLMASEAANPLFGELLSYYDERPFLREDGSMDVTTNTVTVTNALIEHGLRPENKVQQLEHVTVYPEDFFCPKNPWSGEVHVTENTYCIHHFHGAWNDTADKDMPFIRGIPAMVDGFLKRRRKDVACPVVIYGLGVVGRNVYEELRRQAPAMEIAGFLVSRYDNGWRELDGLPIVELEAAGERFGDVAVLIATIPRYHHEIKKGLQRQGLCNRIYGLGEEDDGGLQGIL